MQTLADFLTQVGKAAVDMAQACARQSQARLQEHLDENGEPKTIGIRVGEKTVDVPTITLAPPSVLLPERVELELESDIMLPEEGDNASKDLCLTFRDTGETIETSHVRVKVSLKRQRPHEAMELIRDRLTGRLGDDLHTPEQTGDEP